jgi:hypothetical protein
MQTYLPINNPLISYQFPEIKSLLSKGVGYSDYYKRYDIVNKYRSLCTNWLQSGTNTILKGLNNFPYVYVINGVSHFISDLPKIENRTVVKHINEYNGYSKILEMYNMPSRTEYSYDELDLDIENEVIVISYPVSLNGNKDKSVEKIIEQSKTPVILDGVFMGSNLFNINLDLSNVEKFTFSFSKTFGLTYNRVGILFSKTIIPEYEVYHEYGYHNLNGLGYAIEIMKNYNLDYFTNKYHEVYKRACQIKNAKVGDCILIGQLDTTEQDKKALVTDIFDEIIYGYRKN